MSLAGPTAELRTIAGSLRDLGTPGSKAQNFIAIGVGGEVREALKGQFTQGIDPAGSAWTKNKRKKPALVSNKIPNSIGFYAVEKGVGFKMKIDWLEAHHKGHVFPARSASARTVAKAAVGDKFVSFKKVLQAAKGKNVARMDTARGTLFVRQRKSRSDLLVRAVEIQAHEVNARVLPKRPIYPEGSIPTRWGEAINRGAQLGFEVWAEAAGIK